MADVSKTHDQNASRIGCDAFCTFGSFDFFSPIIQRNSSCPYCSKKLPLPGINSFLALYPEIAEEWAYEANKTRNPDAIFPDNHLTPIVWKCKKCLTLHVATVYDKINEIRGCKNCNSEQPISAERYKFLKSEFLSSDGDIEDFNLMMPDYTTPLKWLCNECNEIFILSLKERYYEARDCACLEGRKAIPGKTSFKALYPAMTYEFSKNNNIDPDTLLPNNSFTMIWDCKKCGFSWKGSIKFRIHEKINCPYCNGRKVIPGKTSFKARYPKLAAECSKTNDIDLDNIFPTSCILPIKWDCPKCNMTWKGYIKERIDGKIDCPYCNGRKAIPGKTSFKALYPEIALECSDVNDVDIDSILPTSNRSFTWNSHECNMSWLY